MDRDTHVYCTKCIRGENLINKTYFDKGNIPKECIKCYPYDIVDSKVFGLRKNYIERKDKIDHDKCPYCGSFNIWRTRDLEVIDDEGFLSKECGDCYGQWDEEYDFMRINHTCPPEEKSK